MGSFRVVYYRAPDGSEPVDEFVDTLDARRQVAIDNQIDLCSGGHGVDEDLPLLVS